MAARCHTEPLRNRTFLGATREQTVCNGLTHSLHNARLRLHTPNQRGGMGLELIDKLGCLFGQRQRQHVWVKQHRILIDAELNFAAEKLLKRRAVAPAKPAETRIHRKRHARQFSTPHNPVAEERKYHLLTGTIWGRFGMRANHRNSVPATLQHELAVAIDNPHVALCSSEHVAEGVA